MRVSHLLALGILLVAATAMAGDKATKPGVGMATMRRMWVERVASHVRATNDYAKAYQKPELINPVPTSWKELPSIFKSPRIMRQLRAMARMSDVTVTPNKLYLVGVDPEHQVRRTIHANGWGAELDTEWRGGQRAGGQSWLIMPFAQPLEMTEVGHFYVDRATGEKQVRNVDRDRILDRLSDDVIAGFREKVKAGVLTETEAFLQALRLARQLPPKP